MPPRAYYIYILSSPSRELYIGVTNDLQRRLAQHRDPASNPKAFSARHRTSALVYFEQFQDPRTAITREKQLKGWTRRRKLDLVATRNPAFVDLGRELGLTK